MVPEPMHPIHALRGAGKQPVDQSHFRFQPEDNRAIDLILNMLLLNQSPIVTRKTEIRA